MRRRTLLRSAAVAATIGGAGFAGASRNRGGRDETNDRQRTTTETTGTTTRADGGFEIASPAWENGEAIPARYTCDGANASPALTISNPPDGTEAFALVMDDPDAPGPPFVHWLLWNVPVETREIPASIPGEATVPALDGAVHGVNGTGELGYLGPCPPEGDPRHTYLFSLFALDAPLDLAPGATYEAVLTATFPTAIARARYVGQYERG